MKTCISSATRAAVVARVHCLLIIALVAPIGLVRDRRQEPPPPPPPEGPKSDLCDYYNCDFAPVPEEVDCAIGPRPADAVRTANLRMEVHAWEDQRCNALVVDLTNLTLGDLYVWDAGLRFAPPIRWGLEGKGLMIMEDPPLHVEPWPEAWGPVRKVSDKDYFPCDFIEEPYWAKVQSLASMATKRWSVSLEKVQTNDTRNLFPNFYTEHWHRGVPFKTLKVVIRAASFEEILPENGKAVEQRMNAVHHLAFELKLSHVIEVAEYDPHHHYIEEYEQPRLKGWLSPFLFDRSGKLMEPRVPGFL